MLAHYKIIFAAAAGVALGFETAIGAAADNQDMREAVVETGVSTARAVCLALTLLIAVHSVFKFQRDACTEEIAKKQPQLRPIRQKVSVTRKAWNGNADDSTDTGSSVSDSESSTDSESVQPSRVPAGLKEVISEPISMDTLLKHRPRVLRGTTSPVGCLRTKIFKNKAQSLEPSCTVSQPEPSCTVSQPAPPCTVSQPAPPWKRDAALKRSALPSQGVARDFSVLSSAPMKQVARAPSSPTSGMKDAPSSTAGRNLTALCSLLSEPSIQDLSTDRDLSNLRSSTPGSLTGGRLTGAGGLRPLSGSLGPQSGSLTGAGGLRPQSTSLTCDGGLRPHRSPSGGSGSLSGAISLRPRWHTPAQAHEEEDADITPSRLLW